MSHIKYYRILFYVIALMMTVNSNGQTFSIKSDNGITASYFHVINLPSGYLTCGRGFDSINSVLVQPTYLRTYNFSGNFTGGVSLYSDSILWNFNLDCNSVYGTSNILFGGFQVSDLTDSIFDVLLFADLSGNIIDTALFLSPYFNSNEDISNYTFPSALTTDQTVEFIYMVSQVVDYPPIQNNFIIRKINAEGEVLWTYINPIDEWYYSANDLTFKNDTLWFISIASGNLGHYNKLMGLSPDSGEVIFEVEHNGASFPVGGCEDMILTDDGPVIANTIGDSDGTLPFLYKMDFAGNYIWQAQPLGDFAYDQTNNHLVQSGDGGFVSCGEKYDEEPSWLYPNDPAMNNTMKRIWLWKVDADGNFLWQRFYAYYDFNYSEEYFHLTNIAHDMKATPDGGFIMAGEASASCTNYPTCDEFTQQGWLLKVDGCGCLVPGCDPDCIVGVEEIVAEDEIKYFRFGPNPVSDMLNLYIPSLSIPMNELNFSLYDNLGRKVNDFQFKYDDTTYMIDASNLASGEYILLLSQNGQIVQSEKVVKK